MAINTRKKSKRIPLQKEIWYKVRYWQNINDVSDKDLAEYLGCSECTLHNYGAASSPVTLKTVNTFLYVIDMTFLEFMSVA